MNGLVIASPGGVRRGRRILTWRCAGAPPFPLRVAGGCSWLSGEQSADRGERFDDQRGDAAREGGAECGAGEQHTGHEAE